MTSPWVQFGQAVSAIVGTWLLAFGLKSMKETHGTFDTSSPHPLSWRFWAGLILVSVATLPALVSPFITVSRSGQPTGQSSVDLSMNSKPGEGSGGVYNLVCHDVSEVQKSPWVLRINQAEKTAEMIVDVPTDSINIGVPPGNRRGRLVAASERTYEVVIPADSGGQGQQAWSRMQFAFEIDRFTNNGTLAIGEERYGEVPKYQIRCEAGPRSPRF
ncbi:MAG: hypothetical protein HY645_06835 [Acidobacteria bacterium]|nr:hypothetical protein [Acidobacteriota bacterium]